MDQVNVYVNQMQLAGRWQRRKQPNPQLNLTE
jgi:hypothetical protein